MVAHQNIFQRVEKKYLLTRQQYDMLFSAIKDKLHDNEWPNSKILNLYYDNDNWDLAVRSIQKPIYKEKIRLRSYNVPGKNDKVFLELKKKCKGVVGKRRIALTISDYYKYINEGYIDNPENQQIYDEIDYSFKRYKLYPRMMVAYDREAYYLTENPDIRITFDFNLRWRTTDLDLTLADAGKMFFDDGMCIMEIKALECMPLWLVKTLNEMKIYPTSFSKYGEMYKRTVCNELKKGIVV